MDKLSPAGTIFSRMYSSFGDPENVGLVTGFITNPRGRSRPHRRCRTSRPDLGWRRPLRLVATTAEDRLNIR